MFARATPPACWWCKHDSFGNSTPSWSGDGRPRVGEDEDIAVLAGKAARLAAKRAAMLGTLDLCELRTMVEDIAMDIAGGNLALAARLLGCCRTTLFRRVRRRRVDCAKRMTWR